MAEVVKPTVETVKNRVFIVDPNPPGMTMHPPEDLFIYISFKADNRDRSTFVGKDLKTGKDKYINTGTEGEINFIATQVDFNAEGEIILNDDNKQKTYTTTNYVNMGGISDPEGSGILEGFGIKSIDIKYNASLVPVVDITFTDVRGAALFDTVSQNNRKSPYSVFFKMPYPVFTLSVKGYFGKTVDYCLHLLNWTSDFDGTTGNFDISANFVGFQQAFLADMVLGNIIGAVNTGIGTTKLNNIFNEEQQQKNPPPEINGNIRKLDNLFLQISKLQIEFADIKENSKSFELLKAINTQKNKLERIQSFIGIPIQKVKSKGPWEEKTNDPSDVKTAPILDNSLRPGRDYLSLRDYIVYNAINVKSIKEYFQTLNDLIIDYEKLLIDYPELNEDDETIAAFGDITSPDNYENFLVSIADTTEAVALEVVFVTFATSQGILNTHYTNPGDTDPNPNASFASVEEFGTPIKKKTYVRQMTLNNFVQVLDFTEMRGRLQKKLNFIREEVEEQKELTTNELNKKLADNLGFTPTIKDIFRIICNNTQAMLSTVHEVTETAESPANKEDREEALRNYGTDIPQTSKHNFGWPKVLETTDGKGIIEIYLGEVRGIDSYKQSFPEIDFVDKVHQILTGKRKELHEISQVTNAINGLDNDNWFPINPIDFQVNPFIKLNNENQIDTILDECTKQLLVRSTTLWTYSQFPNPLSVYATFDGINANKTIFSKNVRSIIKENLTKDDVIKRGKALNLIEDFTSTDGDKYYRIIEKGSVGRVFQKIGHKKISGYRNNATTKEDINYIILDESGIINNGKKLWKEIKDLDVFKNLIKEEEKETNYRSWYKSNNYTTNLFNNIWNSTVKTKLHSLKKAGLPSNKTYRLPKINVPSDMGDPRNYINLLLPYVDANDTTVYEEFLTDSPLYIDQAGPNKRYNQAILLLSTLPFMSFDDSVLKTFTDQRARILSIPKYYLYFIGGLLWRAEQSTDPLWAINKYPNLKTSKNNYLTNLGSFNNRIATSHEAYPLEAAITQLPTLTKNVLINLFTTWAKMSSGFLKFETNAKTFQSKGGSTLLARNSASDVLNVELKKLTQMILPAPSIFFPATTGPVNLQEGLLIPVPEYNTYFNKFKSKFDNIEKENKKGEVSSSTNSEVDTNKSNNKIKLQIYNYFKNINDKWVSDDDKVFNACGSKNKNLIDYFKFIDRGWKDIGNKASINLNSLLTLSNSLDTSVYFYISKILRDSNFLLQILPNYIDYKDPEEVQSMFLPITNVSDENKSSGPVYTCIYAGGNSESLDIGEQNRYSFSDDGFSFSNGQLPPDINPEENDPSLVAFRVAFGSENQTIFKNVSLSQQEHRETAEYFEVLAQTIDKRGGTQRSYQGNDLLRLFKTRSYTCKVDALGCMNIQPLMYFDLQKRTIFSWGIFNNGS